MGKTKRVLLVLVVLALAAVGGVPADDDCTITCSPGTWNEFTWKCMGYPWPATCENCVVRCPGGGDNPGPFDDY